MTTPDPAMADGSGRAAQRRGRRPHQPCPAALGGLLLALLALVGRAVPAGADPTISTNPPITTMAVGDYAAVQIYVDNSGDPISCFMVQIHFDPTVVEVTEVVEGLLFQASGLATWPVDDLITADTLQVGNCVLGTGTFIMGPGPLADIVFHSLADGYSPIEFTFVQIRDVDRIPYGNPGVQHGAIVVGTAGVGNAGPAPAGAAAQLRVSPNPAPGWARIELMGARGARIETLGELDIYDIGGRLQRTLSGAGGVRGSLTWDGRDGTGRLLPAGIYFVRARGQADLGAKVLLVR